MFSFAYEQTAAENGNGLVDTARYNFSITPSDIQIIRSIGKKSINDFTSEDIQKTEKWARKFWIDLKEKSPFFRAWFGDWRAYDTTNCNAIIISNPNDAEQALSNNEQQVFTRAYSLKNIEVATSIDNGVLFKNEGLTDSQPVALQYSISDLFALVKTNDKDFHPKPVNPLLLNEDGTPKKYYHGSDAKFTFFSSEAISPSEGSYFFAENIEDAKGYGKNIYVVYLTGKRFADYDNQPLEF